MDDIRNRINAQAGRRHELSREILGIDWYDTESQARSVIEHIAEREFTKTAVVEMGPSAYERLTAEPAPAQDEMEPVYQFQWREIGEGDWMACSHSWFRFCEASHEHDTRVVEVARPAQTEQQPVSWTSLAKLKAVNDVGVASMWSERVADDTDVALYAAPIAQTAPQVQSAWTSVEDRLPDPALHARVLIFTDGYDFAGEQYFDVKAESLNEHSFGDPGDQPEPYCKATHWMPLPAASAPQPEQSGKFAIGDRVKKTSGSEWAGRVCGTYSTTLTPEGYAVESEAHAGSVQIYPVTALEAVE